MSEQLDSIVDKVEGEFVSRVKGINDGEVEYVLEQLISRFESYLNRVQVERKEGL